MDNHITQRCGTITNVPYFPNFDENTDDVEAENEDQDEDEESVRDEQEFLEHAEYENRSFCNEEKERDG